MRAKRSSKRAARPESELLDIRQAAALLQVSEASLRRWTNSGRLASFRVGGRRERRFSRADLLAFLEAQPTASSHCSSSDRMGPGHVCGFYSSDLTRVRLAAEFLGEGLVAGKQCLFAAAPDVFDRVSRLLERQRPSLPQDIEAGR